MLLIWFEICSGVEVKLKRKYHQRHRTRQGRPSAAGFIRLHYLHRRGSGTTNRVAMLIFSNITLGTPVDSIFLHHFYERTNWLEIAKQNTDDVDEGFFPSPFDLRTSRCFGRVWIPKSPSYIRIRRWCYMSHRLWPIPSRVVTFQPEWASTSEDRNYYIYICTLRIARNRGN